MYCRDFSRVLLTAFFLFIFAFSLVAQVGRDSQKLELGKPIERELAGGQSHSYEIVLNSGEYVHVVIDQRGIDVVVTLFAPDGKQIAEVDSPNGTQGVEPVFAIATITGIHRLEVRSLEKSAAQDAIRSKSKNFASQTIKTRIGSLLISRSKTPSCCVTRGQRNH